MRALSIVCGLSFAVMAGYLLAVSLTGHSPPRVQPGFGWLCGAMVMLAAFGALAALRARSEGWLPILSGCVLFLICQLVATSMAGTHLVTLMCLAAAGISLLPLARTPSSYWRVTG